MFGTDGPRSALRDLRRPLTRALALLLAATGFTGAADAGAAVQTRHEVERAGAKQFACATALGLDGAMVCTTAPVLVVAELSAALGELRQRPGRPKPGAQPFRRDGPIGTLLVIGREGPIADKDRLARLDALQPAFAGLRKQLGEPSVEDLGASGGAWSSVASLAAIGGLLLVLGSLVWHGLHDGALRIGTPPEAELSAAPLSAVPTGGRAASRAGDLVRRRRARPAGWIGTAARAGGTRFGAYRIGEPLGSGAMGIVYRARHDALDRPVAIKLLAPAFAADERVCERLRREALAVARLEHPNVVRVYDAGTHRGQTYIAMQLVEGHALHDLIGTPQLSTPRIAGVVAMVAAALDHAHERGVVHRDVTPRNILVEEVTGRALLVDFGIAACAGQLRLTGVSDLVGTAAYAAPEQLAGSEPDRLADVYALGCVIYELLTGHLPFERATLLAVIHAHGFESPPCVSARRPDLRATAIDAVVEQALAKVPAERWDTAGALAGAVALALEGAESAPRTPRAPVRRV